MLRDDTDRIVALDTAIGDVLVVDNATTRTRGRPRSEATHKAILDATMGILESDDYRAVSMDRIAERAQVGKQTIYRWWNSKPGLILEAFIARGLAGERPRPTGDALENLRLALTHLVNLARQPLAARVLRALFAEAQIDPEFRPVLYQQLVGPQRDVMRQVLLRGLASGQFRAGLDPEVILDAVYGSFLYRLLSGTSEPLDDHFVAGVVQSLKPSLVSPNMP